MIWFKNQAILLLTRIRSVIPQRSVIFTCSIVTLVLNVGLGIRVLRFEYFGLRIYVRTRVIMHIQYFWWVNLLRYNYWHNNKLILAMVKIYSTILEMILLLFEFVFVFNYILNKQWLSCRTNLHFCLINSDIEFTYGSGYNKIICGFFEENYGLFANFCNVLYLRWCIRRVSQMLCISYDICDTFCFDVVILKFFSKRYIIWYYLWRIDKILN